MSDDIIRDVLKKIVLEGKFFTVATGRTCSMEELRYLGMTEEGMYNITMNGALIRDWNGNILYAQPIDRQIVRDCWETFLGTAIYYSGPIYTYIHTEMPEKQRQTKEQPDMTPAQKEERHEFEKLMQHHNHYGSTIEDVLSEPILKISCRFKDEALIDNMESFLQRYEDRIFNAPYDEYGYELTKIHAHKGSSVKWLAGKLQLSPDEVAVYGDSWNDLEMLTMFPHSYTTAEAIPEVKKIVSHVLGSCADHNVPAHILKTLQEEHQVHE